MKSARSQAAAKYRGLVTSTSEPPEPSSEPSSTSGNEVRPKPARWKLVSVITGIVIIQIGNLVANATLFSLIAKHPSWLIVLQPTTKNLILIAGLVPFGVFFFGAVLRRQVPHVLWWFIGKWYGDAGIAWIKQKSPEIASLLQWLEAKFPRYGWLICLLYPHPLVCALAGASPMRFLPFLIVTFIGIIGYVWAAWVGSDLLSPLIDPVTKFSSDHFVPLTVATLGITMLMFWQSNRSGKNKIESVHAIEDELDRELEDKAVEHLRETTERDIQSALEAEVQRPDKNAHRPD